MFCINWLENVLFKIVYLYFLLMKYNPDCLNITFRCLYIFVLNCLFRYCLINVPFVAEIPPFHFWSLLVVMFALTETNVVSVNVAQINYS